EKGNQYVKMGKKHYSDAINHYTRAIDQKALSESDTSIIFANRAHVNFLLGNFRRALNDAQEAIKLCPENVKAHYRAAKAALSLDLLTEAASFCQAGLEQSLNNEELKKLWKQINLRKSERENHVAQVAKAVDVAKDLASAIEDRGIKLGKPMYQALTGLRKPLLDKNNVLHWPVLLLYAEVMSSDFIEDFYSSPPLQWDKENCYTRDAIELYYESCSGVPSSKAAVLQFLLEGTAGSLVENSEEKDTTERSSHGDYAGKSSSKWVKVNEKKTLYEVLRQPDFVIPRIPVFYVVSKRSSFYKEFKAGKWVPPP
ncbi:Tetratricopeptide repeat protein 4-like protein, partial [Thalictrum thalictroides]